MAEPREDQAESEPRFTTAVRTALAWSEEGLYVTVGLLLLAAAVLVVVGTIAGLITSLPVASGRQ